MIRPCRRNNPLSLCHSRKASPPDCKLAISTRMKSAVMGQRVGLTNSLCPFHEPYSSALMSLFFACKLAFWPRVCLRFWWRQLTFVVYACQLAKQMGCLRWSAQNGLLGYGALRVNSSCIAFCVFTDRCSVASARLMRLVLALHKSVITVKITNSWLTLHYTAVYACVGIGAKMCIMVKFDCI
jgi:hypothetical protein